MSTLENEKLITEKFIESAISHENSIDMNEEDKTESEKLILDQIDNEKNADNRTENDKETKVTNSTSVENTEKNSNHNDMTEKIRISKDFKTAEQSTEEPQEPKHEWEDIFDSGVIMKKILKEGEPNSRPHKSEKCIINYTCRLKEGDDFVADKGEEYELILGEADVVQGLDLALSLMNLNERCLLKIESRLAYGAKGLPPHIPGDATVLFDVELLDIQPEYDFEKMSIQERRIVGNKKRERGNWWYQRGENSLAVQCYRYALYVLDDVENEFEENPSDSELQQLLEDRLKVLNNMASAQIKMELYEQAQTSLQTVLRCQPDNVKALYRKSKIAVAKQDFGEALKLLEKAKSLEPEDPLIAKEIGAVHGLISKQRDSEREYARRMFGGAGNGSPAVGKNSAKKDGSKVHLWTTLGATLVVGLAGLFAYKFKYP